MIFSLTFQSITISFLSNQNVVVGFAINRQYGFLLDLILSEYLKRRLVLLSSKREKERCKYSQHVPGLGSFGQCVNVNVGTV